MVLPVTAVTAGYTKITQGNTVFIGEQGLDITSAMGNDTQIGWWAPGAAIATSSPSWQETVATPFYVSPATFGQYTGPWYRLNAQGKPDGMIVAFRVADPNLDIRVLDTTVSVDVTNKWVPRGDQVSFEIDTNLNPIFSRGTSSSEGITINVQPPQGGTYSALIDSSGNANRIEYLAVSTPTYETGPIWDTGNSLYSTGTYTIWAECNVNSMKDNYGVAGKTISQQTSLLDQDQNPLISVNVPTTSPTAQIATTSTTQNPATSSTTVITTIPATSQITTIPSVVATTVPMSTVSSGLTTLETTPTKSAGFGVVLALVSVCALAAVIILKKQH
ncbi:MAG: DUF3821 domain-containing protein [Methanoregula sp.]|jgi:hypothetical protein|uniref:DUF3821 domain-containing protein n=1 Tax=Methanoregula sp. TaxID=2052170 RepID=UPI003D12DD74